MHRESTLRLFLAVPLPPALRRQIDLSADVHRASTPGARFVAPELLHLTMVFLGERPEGTPTLVDVAVAPVLTAVDPFSLQLGGAGCFPSERRPRVFWIGIENGAEQLDELHTALVAALFGSKLIERAERFSPHLTVARIGERVAPAAAGAIGRRWQAAQLPQFAPFAVSDVHLMRSVLRREGPRYSSLISWPLGARRRRSADM